jgi:hypothetical protein
MLAEKRRLEEALSLTGRGSLVSLFLFVWALLTQFFWLIRITVS